MGWNDSPDTFALHEAEIVCFEIHKDYFFVRWSLSGYLLSLCDDILGERYQALVDQGSTMIVDEVFYRPRYDSITMEAGACNDVLDVISAGTENKCFELIAENLAAAKIFSIRFGYRSYRIKLNRIKTYPTEMEWRDRMRQDRGLTEFCLDEFEQREIGDWT